MKISCNPAAVKARFDHYRSETALTVEKVSGGALVTLVSSDGASAAFEVNNLFDFEQLKSILPEERDSNERVNRGFHDDYFVLSISREVYGDPFEECIEFTISIADPVTPWSEYSLRANLSFGDVARFLSEILKHID